MRFLRILQVITPTSIRITSHSNTYDLSATGRRPTTRSRGCPTWRRDCCSWKGTRTRSTCRCAAPYPDQYPSIIPVAASLSGVCVWRSPHACMHTSVPHVSHLTRQKKDRNLTGAAEGGREESVEVAQACSLASLAFQSDAGKVVWPFSHGRRPSQSVIPLSGVTITVQWGGRQRATDGLATSYLLPSPDRR